MGEGWENRGCSGGVGGWDSRVGGGYCLFYATVGPGAW